jgi:biopolymer transport protein ExbB/TolQ
MAAILHEIQSFNAGDWAWLLLIILVLFVGVMIIIFILFKGLKQLRLSVDKNGVKLNENANDKLDVIIDRLAQLERDVVALQIMNEHLTPCERLKRYDYYKQELHGNSFIDEYVSVLKKEIDRSRFA